MHLARGEASVSDLVGLFSLTQPTISSHLKVLESAGLISRSRVAQSRPCKLETEQVKAVTHWLEKVQEIWEGKTRSENSLESMSNFGPAIRLASEGTAIGAQSVTEV